MQDNFDVIVVGAGNAALAASVSAKENGAKRVLVLEKAPREMRGGNTHWNGGVLRFAFDDPREIGPLVPEAEDRATVHRIIYDELVQGRVETASRDAYRKVIARLIERGAEAVILGCTEIMLLVKPEDSRVPLFDTTGIHAQAAVERALST